MYIGRGSDVYWRMDAWFMKMECNVYWTWVGFIIEEEAKCNGTV